MFELQQGGFCVTIHRKGSEQVVNVSFAEGDEDSSTPSTVSR